MSDSTTNFYRLSDDLLKTIATGSGRCYPYEGRAMAEEIIELRRKIIDAEKQVAAATNKGTPVWPLSPP